MGDRTRTMAEALRRHLPHTVSSDTREDGEALIVELVEYVHGVRCSVDERVTDTLADLSFSECGEHLTPFGNGLVEGLATRLLNQLYARPTVPLHKPEYGPSELETAERDLFGTHVPAYSPEQLAEFQRRWKELFVLDADTTTFTKADGTVVEIPKGTRR